MVLWWPSQTSICLSHCWKYGFLVQAVGAAGWFLTTLLSSFDKVHHVWVVETSESCRPGKGFWFHPGTIALLWGAGYLATLLHQICTFQQTRPGPAVCHQDGTQQRRHLFVFTPNNQNTANLLFAPPSECSCMWQILIIENTCFNRTLIIKPLFSIQRCVYIHWEHSVEQVSVCGYSFNCSVFFVCAWWQSSTTFMAFHDPLALYGVSSGKRPRNSGWKKRPSDIFPSQVQCRV